MIEGEARCVGCVKVVLILLYSGVRAGVGVGRASEA